MERARDRRRTHRSPLDVHVTYYEDTTLRAVDKDKDTGEVGGGQRARERRRRKEEVGRAHFALWTL